ncbi:MAG: prepilin peptidase [Oceanospirillales bacterium]|nr:MAG: prepilin peptidase [Oceanospirillales bacterium]
MLLDTFKLSPLRNIPKSPYWITAQARLLFHRIQEKSTLQHYLKEAEKVISIQQTLSSLLDNELLIELEKFKHLSKLDKLSGNREEVLRLLACLREISKRVLGMEPFTVQLLSVLAMYDGYLVQLAPGEGKTLTIGILGVMMGWSRHPCHIITANDYLAERDAKELQPLYKHCGVTVSNVLQSMSQDEKQEAYQANVVYTTAKQLLADYLTDQIQFNGPLDPISLTVKSLQMKQAGQLLMRGVHTAIVDEADNILIDEAITPMIISGKDQNEVLHQAIIAAKQLADLLSTPEHYQLDQVHRDVTLTKAGEILIADQVERLPSVWRGKAWREDLLKQAILAKDYFLIDQHYVVIEDEVVIVDEGTGRPMPGRSWSYGLHQAVEARAGVTLTHPNKTLARMSFQNFFKCYTRLTGASGTLQTIDYELFFNYRTLTLRVPSRLTSQLAIHPFQIYSDKEIKIRRLIDKVKALRSLEIPVLIGTRKIDDSELLAESFQQEGIPYQLLNAKKLAQEAEIVKHAGEPSRVTIATNMAGRGTDIKLTDEIKRNGGLRVLMFEPHESARVDWQLFGRAGRQGNPGEVFPFVAWDDQLLIRNIPKILLLCCRWISRSQGESKLATLLIRFAQYQAQKKAFSLRKFMNESTAKHQKRMSFTRED